MVLDGPKINIQRETMRKLLRILGVWDSQGLYSSVILTEIVPLARAFPPKQPSLAMS